MATYAEMRGIFGDDNYQKKIEAACVDQAVVVLLESDGTAEHATRLKLAFRVLENPVLFGGRFARAVLLKNKAATISQIVNASDSAALTEVAALWNEFATEYGAA